MIINMSNDITIPQEQQQDPGKTPPEKSEYPPGTFSNYIHIDAIVNMRCPLCNQTQVVTQPLSLNETRQGTGYIMPQNCLDCEKRSREEQGERKAQMLMITSIELKLKESPNLSKIPKFDGG